MHEVDPTEVFCRVHFDGEKGGSSSSPSKASSLGGDLKVRGSCHLLLAGDPGTGKSQLMRAAYRILQPCSVFTTGRTSAGGANGKAEWD